MLWVGCCCCFYGGVLTRPPALASCSGHVPDIKRVRYVPNTLAEHWILSPTKNCRTRRAKKQACTTGEPLHAPRQSRFAAPCSATRQKSNSCDASQTAAAEGEKHETLLILRRLSLSQQPEDWTFGTCTRKCHRCWLTHTPQREGNCKTENQLL